MRSNSALRIYLSGGLGNQIFQLYAGLKIAQVGNQIPIVNITSAAKSHSKFNITSFEMPFTVVNNHLLRKLRSNIPQVSTFQNWSRIHSRRHLVDSGFMTNLLLCKNQRFTGISGYFQDLRYFNNQIDFKLTLAKKSASYLQFREMLSQWHYLSVHVRRGDFLGQSGSHGCLSKEWYFAAIQEILGRDKTINQIVYFSDDENWVEEEIKGNFDPGVPQITIGSKFLDDPAESWSLMRDSRHILCSNSTFSITAAICSTAEVTLPSPLTKNDNFRDISNSLPSKWKLEPTKWEE